MRKMFGIYRRNSITLSLWLAKRTQHQEIKVTSHTSKITTVFLEKKMKIDTDIMYMHSSFSYVLVCF